MPRLLPRSRAGRLALAAAGAGALAVGAGAVLAEPDRPVAELEATYADEHSKFVTVDGLRVHYRDEGDPDGPVLVLLHGTFDSLHTWDGWVHELGDAFRIVRLDLPGFGLTGPHPAGNHTVADTVDFLDRFLERLGVESCAVAGNSRGGSIAWQYAVDYPDRVAKLVLVDSTGYPLNQPPGIYWLVSLPGIRDAVRWITPRAVVAHNVRSAYGDHSVVDDALIDRYHDLLLRAGNRQAVLDMAGEDLPVDRTEDIARISVPTLILWGEDDTWVDPADADRFHRDVSDSKLVTYPGLGHVPMAEDPVRTAADVRAFLGE